MDLLPEDAACLIALRLGLRDLSAYSSCSKNSLYVGRKVEERKRRCRRSLFGGEYLNLTRKGMFVRRIFLHRPLGNIWEFCVSHESGHTISLYIPDPVLELSKVRLHHTRPCTAAGRIRPAAGRQTKVGSPDGLSPNNIQYTVLAGAWGSSAQDETYIRSMRDLKLKVAVVHTCNLTTTVMCAVRWTTLSIPLRYEGGGNRGEAMKDVEEKLQTGVPTAAPFRMAANHARFREKTHEARLGEAFYP